MGLRPESVVVPLYCSSYHTGFVHYFLKNEEEYHERSQTSVPENVSQYGDDGPSLVLAINTYSVFVSPRGYWKVDLANHIRGRQRGTDFFNISGKSDISQVGCVTAEALSLMAQQFWP